MTIQLPDDLERYVQAKVESGRFASEQDAITEAVRLLRLAEERPHSTVEIDASASTPPWRRILSNMETVPDAVFDRIPADGSAQLDHHIYGTPRRPNP
jgi:putative addiction module CopG family antidote